MTTTASTAPEYLPADEFTGQRRILGNVKSGVFTAAELAHFIGAGNVSPLFEYQGHVNGRKLFTRTRYYSDGQVIYGYDCTGQLEIIHPADREVRICTK